MWLTNQLWPLALKGVSVSYQHEYYNEVLSPEYGRRKMEDDAMNPDASERCLTDEGMENMFALADHQFHMRQGEAH